MVRCPYHYPPKYGFKADFYNETKFSRHVIIPGFHVQNYHEAKAFADEVVRNLDAKFCLAIDLGVFKSLQNFCLFMNCKVDSYRVKQYKSGVFRAFSDLLIAYVPEDSFKLPSILARKAVKNATKIETDLTDKNIQAVIKLVDELAPSNTLNKVIGNMVIFTWRGTGYCPICEHEHVNDNTHIVIVHDQIVCLHCRHLETNCGKKTTLVLSYLDSSKAEGLRRALLIVADKIP